MSDEFWKAVAGLAWPSLLLILVIAFQKDIRSLIGHVVWRIKAGAAIKLASFEISAPFVTHGENRERVKGIAAINDDTNGDFNKNRDFLKTTNRNLFLVHRLAPSSDKTQLYDVLIYLVPSLKYGSLSRGRLCIRRAGVIDWTRLNGLRYDCAHDHRIARSIPPRPISSESIRSRYLTTVTKKALGGPGLSVPLDLWRS